MSPNASETSSSESRTFSETPSSETIDRAWEAAESDTSVSMDDRSYGPRWMGPLLGLVATGAGLAAAELVVGLFERTSSPVVPVGQVFIDWVPRPLKEWAIDTFGTNDKVVLVVGALVVLLGIGIGVGVLAMRGARSAAVALTCVTGVIGAWAVLTRPEPTLVKLLPDDRRHGGVDRGACCTSRHVPNAVATTVDPRAVLRPSRWASTGAASWAVRSVSGRSR